MALIRFACPLTAPKQPIQWRIGGVSRVEFREPSATLWVRFVGSYSASTKCDWLRSSIG